MASHSIQGHKSRRQMLPEPTDNVIWAMAFLTPEPKTKKRECVLGVKI